MSDLTNLVQSRHSAIKFMSDTPISPAELNEIFELVKLAPSAFNLQHAHYVPVTDESVREQIYQASGGQYKIKLASAVIAVFGDTKAYSRIAEMNEGFLALGMMDRTEFDTTVRDVTEFYERRGAEFQREEAVRNASLSAMMFMLLAKDKGWDTCPMIGFDPQAVAEAVGAPEGMLPVMLITIGKEDRSKPRPRGYRKPVAQFVSYDRF
ncbi:nitroreductase family protein [Saccharibacillus sp. CPCC 101409]|uniref:nitroreductase family protein n=1 Tax=Saccharibacillus sp. CPCC 101409 TaxID=3058041 RepID=UPI002673CD8D|nr:nitroreductase family protein [Saccharibacillus sp. CPCC 101409]MDO3411727.1 nitroreductase family protein [Saccharibacillus sp. CPCC 101409]